MQGQNNNKSLLKGDFILNCPHVIEFVTRLSMLYEAATQKDLKFEIVSRWVFADIEITWSVFRTLSNIYDGDFMGK